jgi:hypothetical protein
MHDRRIHDAAAAKIQPLLGRLLGRRSIPYEAFAELIERPWMASPLFESAS